MQVLSSRPRRQNAPRKSCEAYTFEASSSFDWPKPPPNFAQVNTILACSDVAAYTLAA